MNRSAPFAVFVALLLSPLAGAALLAPELPAAASGQEADPATEHVASGVEALHRGDTEGAEQAFQAAKAANPRMPQPLLGLADVALRRGSREEAKKWLDQALAVSPEDDSVHHALSIQTGFAETG